MVYCANWFYDVLFMHIFKLCDISDIVSLVSILQTCVLYMLSHNFCILHFCTLDVSRNFMKRQFVSL